jgi:zinc transporter 1/2/3
MDCESGLVGEYSESLHVLSVFVIFVVSLLATAIAIFLSSSMKSTVITRLLIASKLLGIGVITGTVFIHILPDAIESFENLCISSRIGEYGTRFVGLIIMISAFLANVLQSLGHDHQQHEIHELVDCGGNSAFLANDTNQYSTQISAVILETGVLLHSLIIGISLGSCSNSEFIPLFIAISFHQFFEGLALGVIVGDTQLSNATKYFLGFLYPISTPFGIIIGIIFRARMGTAQILFFKGIFNSISCGILIYNIYAEVMVNQLVKNNFLKVQPRWFRICSYSGMYAGAALMAILGLWA